MAALASPLLRKPLPMMSRSDTPMDPTHEEDEVTRLDEQTGSCSHHEMSIKDVEFTYTDDYIMGILNYGLKHHDEAR